MRTFAGIDLSMEALPGATTLLNLRHLLEAHALTAKMFAEAVALLGAKAFLIRDGTTVDATIIAAPSSAKNKSKECNREIHQAKKSNAWYFGMKSHIGVDVKSGLIHSVAGTVANAADITRTQALLHSEEKKPLWTPAIWEWRSAQR